MISLVAFVPFAHLVLFAQTIGWPAATGGYLIALIGVGSLCGRILLGIIAEGLGSCRNAAACSVLMAVSLALLSHAAHRWQLGAIAALYSLGYGGIIGLTGPVIAEVLGGARHLRLGWRRNQLARSGHSGRSVGGRDAGAPPRQLSRSVFDLRSPGAVRRGSARHAAPSHSDTPRARSRRSVRNPALRRHTWASRFITRRPEPPRVRQPVRGRLR